MIQALLFLTFLFFADATPAIPAFPGAQGGGAISLGGRGGAVIEVTNRSGSGSGSLRACVEASGPRTCVFRVGGTIDTGGTLSVSKPFLTIAGQTAPGGGIQLRANDSVFILNTNNVVIRYLRIRKGYTANCLGGACGDNIRMGGGATTAIFDHLSTQFSMDESIDTSNGANTTISYSLMGSCFTAHCTGVLSAGSTISVTQNMLNHDFHHNLLMNTSHRNPLYDNHTGRVVNNLFYNFKAIASTFGCGGDWDVIGNKYRRGPLGPNQHYEIAHWGANGPGTKCMPGEPTFFISGNIGWHQTNPSGDQYLMATLQNSGNAPGTIGPIPVGWRRGAPLAATAHPIVAEPVANIDNSIIPTVGASRRLDCNGNWVLNRDTLDTTIITQYITDNGISSLPANESGYGGYPTLAAGTPCPDADHDGMPDQWESDNGLNPNNAADRNGVQPTGFTNLEVYLAGAGGTEPPEPPLPQAPSVSVTAPPNGATSTGSVTVTADASDDASVLGVQFRLDGVILGAEDTTSPYSVVWNTTTASEGAHTLTAVARDAVPNSTTSAPVTVTVDNIGAVDKFDTGDRVEVNNGAITVRTQPTAGGSPGTSLGNQPVGVQGTVLAGPITASNGATYWEINYDTGVDGWSAEQFLDLVGGAVNTPPTVSLTAPASGATVSGPVTVSATAADPGGAVLGVQFKLDGANLGAEDTSSPYSIVWDSSSATDGAHALGAVARDSGAATANAGARTVTVTNTGVCP